MSSSEGAQMKEEKVVVEEQPAAPEAVQVQVSAPEEEEVTVVPETKAARSRAQYLNAQFQLKSKVIRDMWTQHKLLLSKDQSQLLIILVLSFVALFCSVAALSSNSWTCSSAKGVSFGLWNTCYMPLRHLHNATNGNQTNSTGTWTGGKNAHGILCAHQGLYDVHVNYAEQSHIDQITASQGLIISGAVLYLLSIVTLMLAYRFMHLNNLNSVRNALVTGMCVQIVSFCLQMIGFFLFILTDRLAGSISVLFIYFGLAIFVTNGINFYTVEYKTFKTRTLTTA